MYMHWIFPIQALAPDIKRLGKLQRTCHLPGSPHALLTVPPFSGTYKGALWPMVTTMTETRRRPLTRTGALFANHIRTLGTRIRELLVASFARPDPEPAPGWFHYDDDLFFSEVSPKSRRVGARVLAIARKAVTQALKTFDRTAGSYIGLYILAALAEMLEAADAVPALAAVLNAWIPASREPAATSYRGRPVMPWRCGKYWSAASAFFFSRLSVLDPRQRW